MMVRLTTKDQKREVIFDNVSYVLNELDLGSAEAAISTIKGINQVGEYLNSSTIGTRDISITGYVLADSIEEMRQKKRDLIKLVNPLNSFYLVIDQYKLNCVSLDTVKFAAATHENNSQLAKFVLSAKAVNPCFELMNEKTIKVALWKGMFCLPFTVSPSKPFVVGVREPEKISTIKNEGDIATGMVVEFIAKREIKKPYIFNMNTREEIKINKTLKAGEIVRVNTNYGNKTVRGVLNDEETNYFKYLDINSSFIQLESGENLFRWGAETNESSLEVNIIYSPKFLGV